ncbi:DAK2 domain-containing protein [Desulfosporosinus nitroreducens]|uniref:DAK2 domain-containing protein n=1 Tax=Desulfosporosinus nitroreducens TaxID=2018668 RepID=A0ABT8QNZ4_9FIRM|nr:DAK2 domain-containing protein [Desulfosporosinus nitroreducens]MCO1601151.1 DAK2 domain-containing protein [Desulfosporosinus nitroreducens]MDO0821656.1 DAK2 domain-containing protein [Desulfosporosinus nitroreducens]
MVLRPAAAKVTSVLDGQLWRQMMASGAKALELKKHEVDALNVFPVPDGDTGTNMYLTIQSAARDAEKITGKSIGEVAAAASMGSLMGARGNSGVILSQLLRGIAKGLEGLNTANALQVAQALQAGVDTAYKAVMKPVEGTILTVSKETARAALAMAKSGGSLLETLKEAEQKGLKSLAKTPEMLPVLKQAGVVDAGGQGFLVILGGWIAVLTGETSISDTMSETESSLKSNVEGSTATRQEFMQIENLDYPYCTEFLVKGTDLRVEQVKQDLLDRGDCLLVVGTSEVVKIHVHVKNPGKILDYAIQWGSLHQVQIHNMLEQNESMAHAMKENETTEDLQTDTRIEHQGQPLKEFGVVAVAMGQGIADVFISLGADEVVFGGQTMNPSTEDLAEAVRKVPARQVFILPNNGNIIMAARQVKDVVQEREVHVISSKSIPQGISALLSFNSDGEAETNIKNMERGLSSVRSGEVTYAVRDSQYGDLTISDGDILGLIEDVIVSTGKSLYEVAQSTLDKMEWKTHDLVTIFYGEDTKLEEVERLQDWLREENPSIEVEVHPGRQPLYYYIFGVE